MPIYNLNNRVYDIPDDVVKEFEQENPTATMAYQDGEDIYDIQVNQRDEFLKQFPDAKLYVEQSAEEDPFEENMKRFKNGEPIQGVSKQSIIDAHPELGLGGESQSFEVADNEIERLRGIKDTAQKQIDEAGFFDRFFDADTRAAVAARNAAEEALETYSEANRKKDTWFEKNVEGVMRGIFDKAGDLATWDFGASGAFSGYALKNAIDKMEKGEQLSASEQNMLDAFGLASAVQTAYQDKVGMAYRVGGSLPESAAFMGSLMLNPAAGAGRKIAQSAAKAAVKKYGTSLVSKLAKGAARVGGDALEMAVATAVPGAGRIAEDYYNRVNGQSTFDIDENGIIRYGGQMEQEEADDAIWKAFGSQFIENYSESVGNYFAPMGTMLSNLTSKGLKAGGLGKLADVVNDISSSQFSRGLRRFKDATKFDGFVGEYLEEVAGNFMNAATVGDMNFNSPEDPRSVFNPDVNMETALSCALMSGTMYAVEAPVSIYNRRVAKKNLANADKAASELWGDRWEDMRSQMDEADPQLLAQLLTGINNATDLSDEAKQAAKNYATRLMQMQGYNARRLQNQMESTDEANAINNAYDSGAELRTQADKHNAKLAVDRAEAALADDAELMEVVSAGANDPVSTINAMAESGKYSDEQMRKAKDYYTAYWRMNGLTDAVIDRVDSQIESANSEVDANTNFNENTNESTIVPVTLRDGRQGYVIKGTITPGEEGSIDINRSDSFIVVRVDGQEHPMNPNKDLVSVGQITTPEALKEYNGTTLREQLIDKEIGEIDWNPATPNPRVGDSFQLDGVPVTIVSHDGKGGMFVVPTEEYQSAVGSEQKMQELVAKAQQTQPVPAAEYKNWASTTLDVQEEAAKMEQEITSGEAVGEEVNGGVNAGVNNPEEPSMRGTVGSPVALAYLLEGGQGSIENLGYFLHGVAGAFPEVENEIESIRGRIGAEGLGVSPDRFAEVASSQMNEMRNVIVSRYGEIGGQLFDKLVQNATGFVPREGAKIAKQLESLEVVENQEPTPVGKGVFGEIYDQFKGKAKEAIEFLKKKKGGEAIGALHHSEIGDIDLVWGKEGTGKSNGFGLSKLVKFHPEVLDNLQEILDNMVVVRRNENRINLESATHKAAIRLEWDGVRKNWLLTAFEKEAPTATDRTTDIGDTKLQNDTAPLQTVSSSSENKDSENNVQSQEKAQKPFHEREKSDVFRELGEAYGEKMPHKVEVTAKAWADKVKNAQKKVADAQQKLDDSPIGEDAKPKAAVEKAVKELDAIKVQADFWAEMDAEIKAAQQRREEMLNPTLDAESSNEPMNADEFVAQQLSAGNIVLNRDDYMRETGYGKEEANAMNGGTKKLLSAEGMTIQEAGERLMEMDRENGTNFFDQSDPNAGRDALISLLGSVKSRKELNQYIAENRKAQAKKDSEGLRNEMEKAIMDNYHISLEEFVAQMEADELNNPYEGVDFAALDAIFAEAELEREQSLKEQEYDSGRNVEGNQGQSELLSETQSDNEGASGESESGRTADEAGFEPQNDGEVAQVGSSGIDITNPLAVAERIHKEEMRRRPLRERVKEWENLLGVRVNVIERAEDVKNEEALRYMAQGYTPSGWVESNGEVSIYLPGTPDVAEVDKTMIHEVVAHKGLPGLLGRNRFNELCDKVWDMMPEAKQAEYLDYVGDRFGSEQERHRAAADEYMAFLAEGVDLTPQDKSVWKEIVKYIRQVIESVMGKSSITDKDIEELLRASFARFVAYKQEVDARGGRTMLSAKKKRALETASVSKGKHQPTVVSSADGAKILNNLDNLQKEYEEKSSQSKTFLGDVAKAINARKQGSGSQYSTFETVNGNVVTIRLADHNATVSNFDNRNESEGISIVVSAKDNNGITNDGDAHIVEYFYDSIDLRRADGKPLAEIVKSIKQSLYSGEYKDTTGLAERQEVNPSRFRVAKDKNDLVAVHNIPEDNLRKVLSIGGLIMPSIAITKADMGHEGYGEISLLFDKETINPSDRRNKVYGGDAWTPRFPQMTPKLNDKVLAKVRNKIRGLIEDRTLSELYSLSVELHPDNIERTISNKGIEGYYNEEWMKLAYLLDNGKKVKVPMKMKDYGDMSEAIIELAKERGLKVSDIQQESLNFYEKDTDFVGAVKKLVDDKKLSSLPEEKRDELRKLLGEKKMSFAYFDSLVSAATRMEYDLEHGGLKKIIDRSSLRESIEKKVKTNNADYNKWVDNLFDGIIEKYGIRNDRDWYTPSGNLRPWGQLYDDATPSNILRHMLAENEQGGGGGFFDSNIMGASAETYESIEEIREKGKKRLRRLEEGEYDEWSNSVSERMAEICYEFLSERQRNEFGASIDAKIAITNAVAKDKTAKGIYKAMKRDYPGFTMEHAKRVEEIVKEIQDFAIGYFEAKPRRIVPLSEVRKAIVPKKTSEDILEGLKDNGIEVATYKGGDEAARARLIKKESNGIRFRVSNRNQEIFVSNAQKAVEGIKQEKGTPQQWLAMIEKNSGLKAGEDKWLGLSDWLKGSDKKSLTKSEILDFINQNKIVIEEVKYSGNEDDIQTIGNGLADSRGIEFRNDFMDAFGLDYGEFYIANEEMAIDLYNKNNSNQLELDEYGYLDERAEEVLIEWAQSVVGESTSKPINSTRLNYTTKGLDNKQEIALTVPSIEPWNQDDEIHFGDAGEGRAVAWIRFGETTTPNVAFINAREAVNNYIAEMREKYNVRGGGIYDVMNEEEVKHLQELTSAEFDTRDKVERVLVIDEIQSKRHQEGRERGYKNEEIRKNYTYEEVDTINGRQMVLRLNGNISFHPIGTTLEEAIREFEEDSLPFDIDRRVPVAPFEKNWHELAMKRMLRYAAENGFDKVAWTKGDQQAERYNIGGVVDSINYFLRGDGTYRVETYGKNGYQIESVPTEYESEKALADVFGKELATKMVKDLEEDRASVEEAKKAKKGIRDKMRGMDDTSAEYESLLEEFGKYDSIQSKADQGHTISGDGLRVGGEGMKGFYDRMLPSFVNKYVKKWGTKVQDVELPNVEEAGRFMHSVDVTDGMKESVMEGQTMFRIIDKKKEDIQKSVDKFASKYNSKPVEIIDMTMTDEEIEDAVEWTQTASDLRTYINNESAMGGYVKDIDKILIFADNMKLERMEEAMFHENLHPSVDGGEYNHLVEKLYEEGKDDEALSRAKRFSDREKKGKRPLEFFVYAVSYGQEQGNLDDVLKYFDKQEQEELLNLLKINGYDYENEQGRRRGHAVLGELPQGEKRTGRNVQEVSEGEQKTQEGKRAEAREQAERLRNLFDQVADMGLDGVLGNEAYDKAMMDIYAILPENARKEVIEDTFRHYGTNFVPAVSDYIGVKADGKLMDRIIAIVREALRKVGFDLELTSGDVKYLAWRSKKPINRNLALDVAEDMDARMRFRVTGEKTPSGTRFRTNVSNKAKVRDEYEALTKKGGYQAREALQDAMLSLRKFQELLEKATGKKIRGFENAWWHENRMSSMTQSAIHEMERKFYKPMTEAVKKLMEKANLSEYEVADYLMLKHGIERNREMAVRKALTDSDGKIDRDKLNDWYEEKRRIRNDASLDSWRKKQEAMDDAALMFGADMSRDYSGLTSMFDTDDLAECTNKAYDEVERLEKAHSKETEAVGKAVKAMTQSSLDYAYESGLMDKKVYDELTNDMYDYYIPLRGFDETTSDEVYAYMDNDRGAFNAPLRRAKGRSSKADNPLAYMKSIAESGIMQGNRNKMKQSFLALVMNRPSDLVSVKEGVWAVLNPASGEWEAASIPDIRFPRNATPADIEAAYQQWEAEMEQRAQQDPDNVRKISEADDVPYRVIGNRMSQHQVVVKWNGKSYTLTVNGNPRLAMAINGLTNPNNTSNDGKVAASVQKAINKINRSLAAWYTTRNPDFVASNFMRDTFYTNTIVRAKEGNHYANHFHKHYAKLLMPGKMLGLFSKWENGTLDMNKPLERDFHEFMVNGGETGYSNLKDMEEIKKQISKDLNGKRLEKVKKALEVLDRVNRAVENTSRFAAFRTSKQVGRTTERAIFDAKEISVNFNKKGSGGTFFKSVGQTRMGNLAAMVGAGGRALYVFFNAAIQGTTNLMHVMKNNPKGTGAGCAAMFLMGAVVPMLFAGDDDEKDYYDLPEHVRRNHLILPGGGDAWISIPLPIEYRIMYGMGELLTSWRTGHERGSDIGRKMLSMTGQALPLNFLEEGVDAFVPSAMSPLWQVYNNRSWTGLPIYKDNEFNKDDPEYTKAYKNVNRMVYEFTKGMYDWTFDEENQDSGLDLNPAVIEHVAEGYFGGLVKTIDNLWKTGEMAFGDRDFDWRNIPIGNRALKTGDERTKEKRVTNEYFEHLERLDFLQSRERMIRKTMEGAAVPEADKEKARKDYEALLGSETYKEYMSFKEAKKRVDRLRQAMKKQGASDELSKQLSELMEAANKTVE